WVRIRVCRTPPTWTRRPPVFRASRPRWRCWSFPRRSPLPLARASRRRDTRRRSPLRERRRPLPQRRPLPPPSPEDPPGSARRRRHPRRGCRTSSPPSLLRGTCGLRVDPRNRQRQSPALSLIGPPRRLRVERLQGEPEVSRWRISSWVVRRIHTYLDESDLSFTLSSGPRSWEAWEPLTLPMVGNRVAFRATDRLGRRSRSRRRAFVQTSRLL